MLRVLGILANILRICGSKKIKFLVEKNTSGKIKQAQHNIENL
jgi:hypothetical protein